MRPAPCTRPYGEVGSCSKSLSSFTMRRQMNRHSTSYERCEATSTTHRLVTHAHGQTGSRKNSTSLIGSGYGKARVHPSRPPAEHVGNVGEPRRAQDARCGARPVTARAVHDGRRIAIELVEPRHELGEGDRHCARNRAPLELTGTADVEDLHVGVGRELRRRHTGRGVDELRVGEELADRIREDSRRRCRSRSERDAPALRSRAPGERPTRCGCPPRRPPRCTRRSGRRVRR